MAAMVVDDGLLQCLNRERFQKVLAPKVNGAWNLHIQTLNDPSDFFILYSSFTSIIGTLGQGNYVAANTFLDALAAYRRALGLPALSINWGAVSDVGYVVRNPDLEWRLIERFGVKPLPSAQLLGILEELIQQETTQIAVGQLDWLQIAKMKLAGVSTRFSDFRHSLINCLVHATDLPADIEIPQLGDDQVAYCC